MQQGHHAALRIGDNLNLFEKLDESNGAPKSSKELAKMTSSDPQLIGRLRTLQNSRQSGC